MHLKHQSIETPEGTFVASYSEEGLASLTFPGRRARTERFSNGTSAQIRQWHKKTVEAVDAVLKGKRPRAFPPLDLSAGTRFQQRVWAAMQALALGEVASYSTIAQRIGSPRACRAVGSACGANPIPLLIPCHRVLATGGRLGGFSGGLEWKKILLAREGFSVQDGLVARRSD